jgi:hypothetical protein
MKAVHVLGHIDCPTCGTVGGMRITADKNGDPFGYCEAECSQQLRVGGDARRVRKFLARYPWAAGQEQQQTAPAVKAPDRDPAPQEPPAKKRAGWADGLAALGVSA